MREVLSGRPEAGLKLDQRLGGPTAAGALALLRLGELNQSALPLATELRQRLLLCQCGDGSWGQTSSEKAMLTALCIRSLSALPAARAFGLALGMGGTVADSPPGAGEVREAIRRGVDYLEETQLPGGGWGDGTFRGDAFVTGFVLLQLGRHESFRRKVSMEDAMSLDAQPGESEETELLWSRLRRRCGQSLRLARPQHQVALRQATLQFAEVA